MSSRKSEEAGKEKGGDEEEEADRWGREGPIGQHKVRPRQEEGEKGGGGREVLGPMNEGIFWTAAAVLGRPERCRVCSSDDCYPML